MKCVMDGEKYMIFPIVLVGSSTVCSIVCRYVTKFVGRKECVMVTSIS